MSRESLIVLLGLAVIFVPHVGIPSDWKMYGTSVAGALLVLVGYSLRRSAFRRRLERSEREYGADSFLESNGIFVWNLVFSFDLYSAATFQFARKKNSPIVYPIKPALPQFFTPRLGTDQARLTPDQEPNRSIMIELF